jgi:potassium efflux system protein
LPFAQPDASMNAGNGNPNNSANTAVAPPPAPTVAELRAQFNKITDAGKDGGKDTEDDPRKQLALINDIGAQADKFVAARTGDLADLNARLGELGNPPAAGHHRRPRHHAPARAA